ncbi:hypothetical protein [Pseudomonas lutea]|uniref:Lipoprotein n=1 Tax=Pseudomonas lutea TaxID=243924 RepID=A0A9X0JGW1_9PSED|nr:hypothetical protein [Pseudomonas lutea]KGF62102.1 hypothetical protein LT42_25435 [Pseudomonas lutea]
MRKLIFALMACAALAGCKNEGGDFVGVWKNSGKLPETLTITKAGDGYRAQSHIEDDKEGYMDVEAALVAESNTLLVTSEKEKALELSGGKVTSYLRNGTDTFTKVK